MKKRVILPICFLLIFTISLVYVSSFPDNYVVYDRDDYKDEYVYRRIPKTKTFHITHPDGRSYYRTYHGFNKDIRKSSLGFSDQRDRLGIYLNSFDQRDVPKTRTKDHIEREYPKQRVDCPPGWICEKTSKK